MLMMFTRVALVAQDGTKVENGTDGNVIVTNQMDEEASEEVIVLVREALMLANEGSYDAATDRLRQALTMDSTNVVVLANLGSIENLGGHPERAVEYLERALSASDQPNPAILVGLGLAYVDSGDNEKAILVLSEAITLGPDDVTLGAAYFNRCMAYCRTGQCDLARGDRDRAKEKYRKVKAAKVELERLDGMILRCTEN